jgi:hypothetical protein
MSKTFSEKIDKNFDVSFPRYFLSYRISGCFSAMQVQKHDKKKVLQQNRVEFFLHKIHLLSIPIPKSKTAFLFLSIFFYHLSRFWAFLGDRRKKPRQKSRTKNLTNPGAGTFLVFGLRGTNQPRQGPSVFFF